MFAEKLRSRRELGILAAILVLIVIIAAGIGISTSGVGARFNSGSQQLLQGDAGPRTVNLGESAAICGEQIQHAYGEQLQTRYVDDISTRYDEVRDQFLVITIIDVKEGAEVLNYYVTCAVDADTGRIVNYFVTNPSGSRSSALLGLSD